MTTAPSIKLSGHFDIKGERLFAPISLNLPAGRWTCLLGRSGVGKSTLVRLIAGLECRGDFTGEIATSDGHALADRVSFMAQSDLLLPWLSVLENIALGARLRGLQPDIARAKSLLRNVGLAAYENERPAALSGGMRQRAALARTLLEDRPVALLDEPFSALDAATRVEMQDLSAQMLAGKTVLMVTHDPSEAVRLGHQIIVLTPKGANLWETPVTSPLRDQYTPETLECQAALLSYLRT